MFGVFVNAIAIVIGGLIGSVAKKGMPERISSAVLDVMGLFTLFVGIKGSLTGEKSVVVLISIVIGTVIGSIIDIDKYLESFGEFLKKKFNSKAKKDDAKFVEAFVTASALFGIGAMAILGSIDAGIKKDYNIFYLKSLMDFVTAIMFSTTLGIGVSFSAITIIILQGSMTLLASFIRPIAENVGMMNEISCCGNLLIVALGLNLLGLKKFKVANMLPAIVILPIVYYIATIV